MLVYVAYGIGVLILAAAGFLAWRNSRIIAEQKNNPAPKLLVSSYTMQVTNHFDEQENKALTPLFQVAYQDKQGMMHAYLCRVNGDRGELKLPIAADIMGNKLLDIMAKGILKDAAAHYDAAEGNEEKEAITRLDNLVKQTGGASNAE